MIYNNRLIKACYARSPAFLQNVMLSCYGLSKWRQRRGRVFQAYLRELEGTQWKSGKELERLQDGRLRALIKHAYSNVPYYRRVFKERKLRPADVKCARDLSKLPYLTKEVVKENFGDLMARNVPPRSYVKVCTSGTTGTPMEYLIDKDRVVFSRALQWRQWGWHGYEFGDAVGVLRGIMDKPASDAKPPFWRKNVWENTTYYSSFHVSENTVGDYVKELVKSETKFVWAWPSSLYALARHMNNLGLTLPLNAVFTGSETLSSKQRELMQEVFACKVFDEYGQAERACRAGECPHGGIHVDAEYGILELGGEGGVSGGGSMGEIAATSLTNYCMPLINYLTGDLAKPCKQKCECGRGLTLLESIEGRVDDFILTPEGSLVGRMDQALWGLKNVAYVQFFQETADSVTLKVVKDNGYSSRDEKFLLSRVRRRLGESIKIKVEFVDEPVRTKGGKIKAITSKLSAGGASK